MTSRRPVLDVISHSPEQTRHLGQTLGRLAEPGDLYLLHGQIGAGKTTFVQGVARGLGVRGYVQSPTFTLAAEHQGRQANGRPIYLYHLDLYRIESPEDLASFGYEDYLGAPDGVTVVEWPERLGSDLPDEYLLINLEHLSDSKRRIAFVPHGARAERLVDALRSEVSGARRRAAPAGD